MAKTSPLALATLLTAQLATSPLSAQERPSPEALLEAKLAAPFLAHADWTTDYDIALERAREHRKLIFGYFTTAGP